MKVGETFIITNHPPYSMFGHNKVEAKFIEITVIEQKEDVPGEFSGKPQGTGFIAKGSDGYQYSYNYPRYNESFNDTCWVRHMEDDEFDKLTEAQKDELTKDYLWSDVTRFQCPALPKFAISFQRHLVWCEQHQNLHYSDEECFYCKHIPDKQRKVILNMEEHKWMGWYD